MFFRQILNFYSILILYRRTKFLEAYGRASQYANDTMVSIVEAHGRASMRCPPPPHKQNSSKYSSTNYSYILFLYNEFIERSFCYLQIILRNLQDRLEYY